MNRHLPALVTVALSAILASALPAPAATIGVIGVASWQPVPGGGAATRRYSNDLVIDHTRNPIVRLDIAVVASQGDHQGVSQVVFDLVSPEAKQKGYFFNYINPEGNTGMFRAGTGYSNFLEDSPSPQTTMSPAYLSPLASPLPPRYGAGWGWTNSFLPHNGVTSSNPGTVSGAGDSLPLTWSGDLAPDFPGNQSFARLGVGLGLNVAPDFDPVFVGLALGFGSDVANRVPGGGGEWWFHSLLIDTTNWDEQYYTFNITTTAGNVLRINDRDDGTPIDYSQPLGGGFREAVIGENLFGSSFRFRIIPEPGSIAFIVLGGLALIRRP